jgi:hypothetical protein
MNDSELARRSAAILLFATLSIATGRGVNSQTAPKHFWEDWREHGPVAGEVIVGVTSDSLDSRITPTSFFARLPASHPPVACVSIVSQDNRYRAEIEYDVGNLPSTDRQFSIPTQHSGRLQQYRTGQVAMLFRLATNCKERDYVIANTSWREPPGKQLNVLINSREYESVVRVRYGDRFEAFPCAELKLAPAVTFNRVCRLELNVNKRPDAITLRRSRFGSVLNTNLPIAAQ